MNKVSCSIAFLLLVSSALFAQVSINTDYSPPDPSAMLDVKSADHGILIPRVSTSGRDLLPSPATGLLIYNTTTNLFNFYNGSFWFQIEATFITSTTGSSSTSGGISISMEPGNLPDNSAMLDISDPGRGLLIPRTTPASITSPATGIIIYNTSNNRVNYYRNGYWSEITSTSTGQIGATGSQTPLGCSIKQDGTGPDPSAIMDVSSPDKGLLIPRMTSEERDAILPATGLAIYNSSANTIDYFNGTGWCQMNVNFGCGTPLEDSRDGHIYNTVQIGTQCWMAQNLNIGTMINSSVTQTNNSILEKYCYNNDISNCDTYGGLYQWNEMMQYVTSEGVQGICPTDWHIPTNAEWTTVTTFLGGSSLAGGKMKETGTTHWSNPNTGATNTSGFTALPGGYRSWYGGTFSDLNAYACLWSSTEGSSTYAWEWELSYVSESVSSNNLQKTYGFSGRCIKD